MNSDHSSDFQKSLEFYAIQYYSENTSSKIIFGKKYEIGGVEFAFDFYAEDESLFGEIYSGIGLLKSGSKRKVLSDCFKLLSIELLLGKKIKKIIVFFDERVLNQFKTTSWASHAIQEFGIDLKLIEIPTETIKKLEETKRQQGLAFSTKKKPT
jgi:hypothetical protein